MKRSTSLAVAGALLLAVVAAAVPSVRLQASQGSGCMPTTGTISGLTFAQAVNAAFAALLSSNSGASAPVNDCSAAAVKGQLWLDTSVTPNLLKQYDGAQWLVLGAQDATNHLWSPPIGGGNASVTAASTTDVCAAPAAVQTISGTVTITSLGSSCVVGVRKTLIFNAATPVTYNATSLILPGQRNYTASAGDVADAIYLGGGNWRVVSITKIDGSSVTNPAVPLGTILYGDYGNIPDKTVIADGRALSRAAYPDYLAAVTRRQAGTLTAGNQTITSVADTRGLGAGMPLEGTGIQAGTTILSVTSSTIIMSAGATANGAQYVTAFLTGYGSGGDSTTVGAKVCAGRMMAGLDPTGAVLPGAAAYNLTQGSATRTLSTPNLPSLIPTGTVGVTLTVTQPTNAWGPVGSDGPVKQALFPGLSGATGTVSPSGVAVGVSVSGTSFTGNQIGGTYQPFSIVPPVATAECVVVALP